MLVVDWLIFGHGVFPAVKSKTPHVTLLGRSYWISYIHTRSKKTKETKKLIYSIGNFLCNKIPWFAIMSKATSQAFSSYWRNRTVLSFRERYRLTVFVSNGTMAVMAQRGVSLKSVLTCYEKNKMIFFFIWAAIDFMTINISWFLLNIKQHPSPISRKPQTVLNGWMAWIVCIVLFSYHKCACPMSRAIAATFWPRGWRALRARRPRGPNVNKKRTSTTRNHCCQKNLHTIQSVRFDHQRTNCPKKNQYWTPEKRNTTVHSQPSKMFSMPEIWTHQEFM